MHSFLDRIARSRRHASTALKIGKILQRANLIRHCHLLPWRLYHLFCRGRRRLDERSKLLLSCEALFLLELLTACHLLLEENAHLRLELLSLLCAMAADAAARHKKAREHGQTLMASWKN